MAVADAQSSLYHANTIAASDLADETAVMLDRGSGDSADLAAKSRDEGPAMVEFRLRPMRRWTGLSAAERQPSDCHCGCGDECRA